MKSEKTISDIARWRLENQQIAGTTFGKPGHVVGWLGAVQAQDYLGALWAVGLRTKGATEAGVEKAIADRAIVRTWPMRGTLHFVAAADVRWMLKLLTPSIVEGGASRLHRQFGLDESTFARGRELFASALAGGKQLTRRAMYGVLEDAGISTAGGRGLHILSRLAQDGHLCFGAREGKQQTFALLDEWVPPAKTLGREEALAELARRYFTSHGPATLQDFVWWSGLRTADAKAALEMARSRLLREVVGGHTYWLAGSAPAAKGVSPVAYLLPPYDEYAVGYKDRSAVLNPSFAKQARAGNGLSPIIVIDGQVAGTWKRAPKKEPLTITARPFRRLDEAETRALAIAAERYSRFTSSISDRDAAVNYDRLPRDEGRGV